MSDPIEGGVQPVMRRSGIDCGEAIDLIPALALGAIESAERLLLQAHCEHCVDCSTELKASSYASSLLAYAVPLVDPPARAKLALFDRIAPAAMIATTPELNIDHFGSPWVSSPGDKRRRKSNEGAGTVEGRFAPASVTSPINRWTGRVSKLAVAPLALALVLVSVYAMQTRNDVNDLQAVNASLISASLISPNANTDGDVSGAGTVADSQVELATKTIDSASDLIAQPVLYTFSAAGNDGQTTSAKNVSPVSSTCKMAGDGTGKYHLRLSGVDLPASSNLAAVYLQSPTGTRTFLTTVLIDGNGYGEATFSLNAGIAENSTLLIGSATSGSANAQPVNGGTTYLLTSDDSDVTGLGA
ncbi:MAG: zf-HC2 domain-containing protein [Thermomicrobiales bacterium]